MKNKNILVSAVLIGLLPLAASAQDSGWSGNGELGFAAARGNAKSEALNAKLQVKKEDERWKHNAYVTALRSKGEVKTATIGTVNGAPAIVETKAYTLTANRFEAGASSGYKLDERSYIVGALRYENDDFSPFTYQWIASLGYGYTVLKNERSELSIEVGPGYKRYRPVDTITAISVTPPVVVRTSYRTQGEVVARGLVAFKHNFSENTAFVDTFLVEAGRKNKFMQNDAGLVVSINKAFALKAGWQVRRNSDVLPGIKNTDHLITTNLVYNFGGGQ